MVNKISTVFEFDQKGNGLKKVQADLKQTEGGLNKVKTASKGAWAELKSNKVAQGALFGAAITGAKMAVDAASDLEESINAVKVTYGEAAEGVLAIGENSAKSFGLATADFNALSVQFSSFAETVAGDGGDVVGVLDDLVGRSADFASVMNIDVADAARIFQSGLAGETEPLKKFGINLSAAAVNAYALESGLVDSTSEMDEAMKVTARYQLLMQETADTQDDFANTSDSLANQQRILQASMTNLQAEVGQALIPTLSDLAGELQEVADAAKSAQTVFGDLKGPVEGLRDSVPGLSQAWDYLNWQVDTFANPIGTINTAFKTLTGRTNDAEEATRRSGDAFREHGRAIDVSADGIAKYRAEQGAAKRFTEEFAGAIGSLDSELAMIRSNGPQAAAALAGIGDEAEEAASRLEDIEAAFKDLNDEMSDRSAWLDLVDAAADFEDAVLAAEEAEKDFGEGSRELAQANRDMERALMGRIEAIQDYVEEAETIPPEIISEVQALVDQGSLDQAELLLSELEARRTVIVDIRTNLANAPSSDFRNLGVSQEAARNAIPVTSGLLPKKSNELGGIGALGGIVTRPTMALIGEAGPEALIPLNRMPGASPLPNGMGGINVTVNAGMGTDGAAVGRMIVDEIRHYERSNGPGWRAA